MKFLLGVKKNMEQFFSEDGRAFAVTIISATPITVVRTKTAKSDGYSAVQVGHGEKREKLLSKAELGQRKGFVNFRKLKEFRVPEAKLTEYKAGDLLDVSQFTAGDKVAVSGVSKGKGFQGVVKRHGFGGGRRSHGQKHSEREPGAIGGSGGRAGGRVAKGIRMAGRMGSDRVTVKNLMVAAVDKENNTLLIKGALPGKPGTLLEIRKIS
jgi:large subunit ribosomal protein L3